MSDQLTDQARCHGCSWSGPKAEAVEARTPQGGQVYYWCVRCDTLLREYLAGRPISHLQHGRQA